MSHIPNKKSRVAHGLNTCPSQRKTALFRLWQLHEMKYQQPSSRTSFLQTVQTKIGYLCSLGLTYLIASPFEEKDFVHGIIYAVLLN